MNDMNVTFNQVFVCSQAGRMQAHTVSYSNIMKNYHQTYKKLDYIHLKGYDYRWQYLVLVIYRDSVHDPSDVGFNLNNFQ